MTDDAILRAAGLTKRQREIARKLRDGYVAEIARNVPPRQRANAHAILRAPLALEADGDYITRRTMARLVDVGIATFVQRDSRAFYVSTFRAMVATHDALKQFQREIEAEFHALNVEPLPGGKSAYGSVTLLPERRRRG